MAGKPKYIIQADSDVLKHCTIIFAQHADHITALDYQLHSLVDLLLQGGWKGQASDHFFHEMETLVFPALSRLADVLQFTSDMSCKIVSTLETAENESSALFRNAPSGVNTSLQQESDFSEILDIINFENIIDMARDFDDEYGRSVKYIDGAGLALYKLASVVYSVLYSIGLDPDIPENSAQGSIATLLGAIINSLRSRPETLGDLAKAGLIGALDGIGASIIIQAILAIKESLAPNGKWDSIIEKGRTRAEKAVMDAYKSSVQDAITIKTIGDAIRQYLASAEGKPSIAGKITVTNQRRILEITGSDGRLVFRGIVSDYVAIFTESVFEKHGPNYITHMGVFDRLLTFFSHEWEKRGSTSPRYASGETYDSPQFRDILDKINQGGVVTPEEVQQALDAFLNSRDLGFSTPTPSATPAR